MLTGDVVLSDVQAGSTKIVGGVETTIAKRPYQVSVEYSGSHLCGGSIMNENNILTSAQCVSGG